MSDHYEGPEERRRRVQHELLASAFSGLCEYVNSMRGAREVGSKPILVQSGLNDPPEIAVHTTEFGMMTIGFK